VILAALSITGIVSTTHIAVKPNGPDIFIHLQITLNLLAAAYVHFAQAIVSLAPIEECHGCGRMFIAESGKQKCCTPSCASTSCWRRWKERQNVDLSVSFVCCQVVPVEFCKLVSR
jgi:hypothetical protein